MHLQAGAVNSGCRFRAGLQAHVQLMSPFSGFWLLGFNLSYHNKETIYYFTIDPYNLAVKYPGPKKFKLFF